MADNDDPAVLAHQELNVAWRQDILRTLVEAASASRRATFARHCIDKALLKALPELLHEAGAPAACLEALPKASTDTPAAVASVQRLRDLLWKNRPSDTFPKDARSHAVAATGLFTRQLKYLSSQPDNYLKAVDGALWAANMLIWCRLRHDLLRGAAQDWPTHEIKCRSEVDSLLARLAS